MDTYINVAAWIAVIILIGCFIMLLSWYIVRCIERAKSNRIIRQRANALVLNRKRREYEQHILDQSRWEA